MLGMAVWKFSVSDTLTGAHPLSPKSSRNLATIQGSLTPEGPSLTRGMNWEWSMGVQIKESRREFSNELSNSSCFEEPEASQHRPADAQSLAHGGY